MMMVGLTTIDFVASPGNGIVWWRGGISTECNARKPTLKKATLSKGTDLYSLENTCDSRRYPGPTWRLASQATRP